MRNGCEGTIRWWFTVTSCSSSYRHVLRSYSLRCNPSFIHFFALFLALYGLHPRLSPLRYESPLRGVRIWIWLIFSGIIPLLRCTRRRREWTTVGSERYALRKGCKGCRRVGERGTSVGERLTKEGAVMGSLFHLICPPSGPKAVGREVGRAGLQDRWGEERQVKRETVRWSDTPGSPCHSTLLIIPFLTVRNEWA